ncbi:hypothetical protein Tco_0796341 [Tanacetum coccineum]
MLTAAEHMFPGNVNLIGLDDKYINSLKCTSGGNNSGTNEMMPGTQEKEKDVQGEVVTDIQEKDKNRSQNDKTEHENGKAMRSQKDKSQSQQKVKFKVNPEMRH